MTSRREVSDAVKRAVFAATLKQDPRAKTWGSAAWNISKAEGEFETWIERGLEHIPAVDRQLAELGHAVFEGKPSSLLNELEADLPEGLFALGQLKGLGAKKVRALWQDLGVTTLGELEYAIEENRLLSLAGFGPKTQKSIIAGIEKFRGIEGLMRRDDAQALLTALQAEAKTLGLEAVVAGAYRRGLETMRGVTLVVSPGAATRDVAEAFATNASKRRAVLVVFSEHEDLGTTMILHTGSDEHIAALRALGPLAGATEQDVYHNLGLSWTPPERREAQVPLVKIGKVRPTLVCLGDLQGALHNHTTASDGRATLQEMRDAARDLGLSYLGISEHSPAASYAGGLSPEKLLRQIRRIGALNQDGHACFLFTGTESDILEDGSLDYEDALLSKLDVVVASVHRRYKQDDASMTTRMLRATAHPSVAIVGHPTGRLLLSRPTSGVDIAQLLDGCARRGCAIELNANPHRLDLSAKHTAMAKERGVLVSIGADAHSTDGLRNLRHGVAIARRAGLGPEHILNTKTRAELTEWTGALSD